MLRLIKNTATKASRAPIAIDPIASKTGLPVTWCSAMPIAASMMPTNAEKSSKKTARRVGFDVRAT